MTDESELVEVASFTNEPEAQLARSRLEASGITAVVFTDDCGGMHPHLQRLGGVKLYVARELAERARDILRLDNAGE